MQDHDSDPEAHRPSGGGPPADSGSPAAAASPTAPAGDAPEGRAARLRQWWGSRRLPRPRPRPRFDLRPRASGPAAPVDAAPADADLPVGSTDPGHAHRAVQLAHPVQLGFLMTVGVGLALLLFGILSANTQLLVWIGAALFISLGLDPVVRRIESWGAPRGVGVAAAVVMLAAILSAFFSLLIPSVVEQTTGFINDLPRMVSDFLESELFNDLDQRFGIHDIAVQELNKFIGDSANVTALFGGLFGVGSVIVNTGFSVLIVLVLTLYFLSTLPAMKYWAYRLAPASRRARVEYLGEEITSSVGHYVMGQSVVAGVNGLVAFLAISIAGVPFGVLLAFFAGLMAFIPLVGAMTGGIVITLVALINGWQSALIFAAIYFIYLQVEAYFVSPRVMRKAVAVPGSVAVIAVIAGAALLGVLGALMAIPLAAAVMLILREVLIPRQDRL